MKLNIKKFMMTEMGGELEETIKAWDQALEERRKATPGIGDPDQGIGFGYLEDNENVPEVYNVTQPSVYNVIGASGIKRATVIKDFAYTITTRQDRTPAQVIDCGSGRYRYLTERECWRLMGYTDEEFEAAKAVHERKGRYYMTLYKQAGNSIAVPIFESIFRKIILGEEKRKKDDSERQEGDAGR